MRSRSFLFSLGIFFSITLLAAACQKAQPSSPSQTGNTGNHNLHNSAKHIPHYEYVIDKFNFHRPVTNCTKGLWFCLQGHWEQIDDGLTPSARMNHDSALVWGQESGINQFTMHFPLGLNDSTLGYDPNDFDTLFADNEYEIYNRGGDTLTIKIGKYPVFQTLNDYVVITNLK